MSIRERTFESLERCVSFLFIDNFITCRCMYVCIYVCMHFPSSAPRRLVSTRERKSLSFNEPNESSFETIDSSTRGRGRRGRGALGLIIFSRESKAAACSFNCFFVPLLFPRGLRTGSIYFPRGRSTTLELETFRH